MSKTPETKENHGHSRMWLYLLLAGLAILAAANFLIAPHGWSQAIALGLGGLLVVFASSEMMILAVDGFARRRKMNTFVAGTMAGLSSNIPELVMLAFVLLATPRVGFIVTILTLHVGAAAFGIYCGVLPRDEKGQAALPKPLVGLSTDLYAAAGGIFFSLGVIMVLMHSFASNSGGATADGGAYLSTTDLYVFGAILLSIQIVAIWRLVSRFSGVHEPQSADDVPIQNENKAKDMSIGAIIGFGLAGLFMSVIGGHAVGEFAGILVERLEAAGFSEMFGAVLLSLFASAGAFILIGTAHAKGKYNIAMANASGAVTQTPFLVLPIAMMLLAAFTQTGLIPVAGSTNGVIPIDLHTTSAIFLAFPSMLILWKAVQDDGKVNWLETTSMIAVFMLAIYLLIMHG